MRLILLLLITLFGVSYLDAQLNAELVGNLGYDESVNDVWGYVSPDGTEYAIVGLQSGVSVVSLADPKKPVEVGRTTGANSPWRDMKTYGPYAYVTADRGSDGLTAIDLRGLPDTIVWKNNLYDVPGFTPQFVRAHNIYIDTVAGRAFTAGGDFNVNDGGILVFDLTKNPMTPDLIAVGPNIYSHDVFVRDSLMYASEIYRKDLAIYNIADLDSIRQVGRTQTPFGFTHNAWPSDGGNVVFTTDELPNASVAAFDVTDLADLKLLDEYRPLTSVNTNTIPHNVHVIDDYLSVSYYTDGLRVVDASVPGNLIEIANYDTWGGADGGFNGNWGAYPFLPSGLTLISDRQSGLYVIDVAYRRAARIEGVVTSTNDNAPINGARVELLTDQPAYDLTSATGNYATGIAKGGFVRVAVSKFGYYSDTLFAVISEGQTFQLNAQLQPRLRTSLNISVVSANDGFSIPNAVVDLANAEISYTGISDSLGSYSAAGVYDLSYETLVSAWGFRASRVDIQITDTLTDIIVALERGYEDSFASDLGWTVTNDSATVDGAWQRGLPTSGKDVDNDFGDQAYFAGQTALKIGDVDNGTSVLASPVFDLSGYPDSSTLSYYYYFADRPVQEGTNDSMLITIDNGRERVELTTYTAGESDWKIDSFVIADYLDLTDSMQLFVLVSDQNPENDIIGAGFDFFRILKSSLSTGTDQFLAVSPITATVTPNPSATDFLLRYDLAGEQNGRLEVFSVTGQRVLSLPLGADAGAMNFGSALTSGIYFARITSQSGRGVAVRKLVKQ